MRAYMYDILAGAVALLARGSAGVVELSPRSSALRDALGRAGVAAEEVPSPEALRERDPRLVLLNGTFHYAKDIHALLDGLKARLAPEARVLCVFYSGLWAPLARLATRLGLRQATPEANWLSVGDVANFAELAGFELLRLERKVLLPLWIPILSMLINRFLAPLPLLRHLALANVAVLRPRAAEPLGSAPSVTVVVPARNERGTIADIVRRVPRMGPNDELIFIEGGSSDGTYEEIERVAREAPPGVRIRFAKQAGKGKGDAVRLGFSMAQCEILMILDADLSVQPEDLPKFYRAVASGTVDFANGSRLVYPMEDRAMRFLNMLANKGFAAGFSFVLGQPLKDTLCGTKVLSRRNYEVIAAHRAYFGDFDPFGDFDLLFGAARLGLKIRDVPVPYCARVYGETNIQRWRHGVMLLRMLILGARRLRFV